MNVYTDDPSDINQVVTAVTGDDLIQLHAEQSDLCHRHSVHKWKFPPNP